MGNWGNFVEGKEWKPRLRKIEHYILDIIGNELYQINNINSQDNPPE